MTRHLAILLAGALAAPAAAGSLTVKPLLDVRTRFETADQAGLPDTSQALTVRARAGAEATTGNWSALVEAQGTLALVDDYANGVDGITSRPIIADPENVALYRAQIRYKADGLSLTAGRQRIGLEDERLIGNAGFRQNAQTFDAVRLEYAHKSGLKADFAYIWSARTIWGVEGQGSRPSSVDGDHLLGSIGYASKFGTLSVFGVQVDEDEVEPRLSSRSYGVRFAGGQPLTKAAKLGWQLSYARQQDNGANPLDHKAAYWLVDLMLDVKGFKLGGGHEVLGADGGRPFTSFQTPFGTNFKFQGWADKFLTTPPDGVRDLYATAGYGVKTLGPLSAITLQATWHRFEADRNVRRYGEEIDLLASAKLKKTTLSIRYADYQAAGFATDTQKFWLQMDWTL